MKAGARARRRLHPLAVVSACLVGQPCRYDGGAKPVPELVQLFEAGLVLPVCPEVLGGLSVPRPPCEIQGRQVRTRDGVNCTAAYRRGARIALGMAMRRGLRVAILKSRSPSCGPGAVYDGTFTGTLRQGDGLFAAALRREGFLLCTEENFADFLSPDTTGLLTEDGISPERARDPGTD